MSSLSISTAQSFGTNAPMMLCFLFGESLLFFGDYESFDELIEECKDSLYLSSEAWIRGVSMFWWDVFISLKSCRLSPPWRGSPGESMLLLPLSRPKPGARKEMSSLIATSNTFSATYALNADKFWSLGVLVAEILVWVWVLGVAGCWFEDWF